MIQRLIEAEVALCMIEMRLVLMKSLASCVMETKTTCCHKSIIIFFI